MRVSRRQGLLVAGALFPWAWFFVRDIHPYADALALAFPLLGTAAVATALLLGALLRRRDIAVIGAAWALLTAVVVVGPWVPRSGPAPDPAIVVVAANTYGDHSPPGLVAVDIVDQGADVVVVSELSPRLRQALERHFEHQVQVPPTWSGGTTTGVFSRFPLIGGPLDDPVLEQRGLRVEVRAPMGSFAVYGVHLNKPGIPPLADGEVGLRSHRRLVDALVDRIEDDDLPVVLAGDLNLIDRASGYRALTGVLDDATRSGWGRYTSLRLTTRPLLARIDHIFMPEAWCSSGGRSFTLTGSDHRGVRARVGPCAD